MGIKNENSIDNFATALLNAKVSLQRSIRSIDELNGRLEELENYGEHFLSLSDEALHTLKEAHDLYGNLPVWDTIEDLAERLFDVRREVVKISREEARNARKDSK